MKTISRNGIQNSGEHADYFGRPSLSLRPFIPVFHFNRILTYRGIFVCVAEVISSTVRYIIQLTPSGAFSVADYIKYITLNFNLN